MKKSIIGATAALCILSAGLVSAAGQSQPDQSISVSAPRATYALGANEFVDYAHVYQLSNGQVARFTQQGNHYFVQLKGSLEALKRDESFGHAAGTPTRLRPVGPGQFVTDKGTQMRFADEGEQVTISNFERLPAAKVASMSRDVQMIARR